MTFLDGNERARRDEPRVHGRRRANLRWMVMGQAAAGVAAVAVVAFVLMERHWNQVTRRLSEAMARQIGAVVDLYEANAGKDQATRREDNARLIALAGERFGFSLSIMEGRSDLPMVHPKPFFDLLDRALSEEISTYVRRPFWLDTVGQSRAIDIRVKTGSDVLRFVAPRSQAYASNSHIFMIWMMGTSVLLLVIPLFFLRRQARFPIQAGGV